MKYMVVETFKPGRKPLVYERLREAGRMLPDGLTYIGSWLERDGERCFQLMETEDETLFQVWTARWNDLVEFDIVPISHPPGAQPGEPETPRVAAFNMVELNRQRREADKAWLEFLNVPTCSMGVYHVAAGTTDRETHDPHDRDEVYVGVGGRGHLTAGGEDFEIETGSVLFVKAGVDHFFRDVTEDLTLLVFFAGASKNVGR